MRVGYAVLLAGLSLTVAMPLAGCATTPADERDPARFEQWRQPLDAPSRPDVRELEAYLAAENLGTVVPLYQLLRSASDWRVCAAEPFSVPPPAQWPAMKSVLQLLQHLRQTGVLETFEVVSAHRDEALNRCAQGAPRSAHFVAFAVDLVAEDPKATGARLCRFWQSQGRAWRMGLSQYPSGRIHIDAHGYRTWGADHSTGTAFCAPLLAATP
ncbi:MAG: hypothetical protein J0L58_04545 [Burkholderiales bacterium]|nr:hypothetical protein [Burkholderiales bacterium]